MFGELAQDAGARALVGLGLIGFFAAPIQHDFFGKRGRKRVVLYQESVKSFEMSCLRLIFISECLFQFDMALQVIFEEAFINDFTRDTLSPLKKRGSFRGYAVRNRIR
jgi:hypothetical protein